MEQYITEAFAQDAEKIELLSIEKNYAEKHDLIPAQVKVIEKPANSRFENAYLERCAKATVDLLLVETPNFLDDQIEHFKKRPEEFLYLESPLFSILGVDAVSLELDDVFGTYTAMFGLKLQKKFGPLIKAYLDTHLTGEEGKYSVAFSEKDGLWDMNFALSYAKGFAEDMTIREAYNLIYAFIFTLLEEVEETE